MKRSFFFHCSVRRDKHSATRAENIVGTERPVPIPCLKKCREIFISCDSQKVFKNYFVATIYVYHHLRFHSNPLFQKKKSLLRSLV